MFFFIYNLIIADKVNRKIVDVHFFYCKRKGKKVDILSSLYAPVCVPMVFGDQLPV